MEVAHRQLEDVGLLQLGDGLALGLQRIDHEVFQLVQALVDPGPPLPLQQGLHHLAVLVGPRHGGRVGGGGGGGGRDGGPGPKVDVGDDVRHGGAGRSRVRVVAPEAVSRLLPVNKEKEEGALLPPPPLSSSSWRVRRRRCP